MAILNEEVIKLYTKCTTGFIETPKSQITIIDGRIRLPSEPKDNKWRFDQDLLDNLKQRSLYDIHSKRIANAFHDMYKGNWTGEVKT